MVALVSGGLLAHYPEQKWMNQTTQHTKKLVPPWSLEVGTCCVFISTQHGDSSYSIYLLSHVHCEAEMNLTGLHEWAPMSVCCELGHTVQAKEPFQLCGCGRTEIYKGEEKWPIFTQWWQQYVFQLQRASGRSLLVLLVPTIRGMSRDLQTDETIRIQYFRSGMITS